MQSTKSDTPQSPTIKQAQTDITPKYEDLRAYYTKPSFEFEKQFDLCSNHGRRLGL